MRVLHIGKYYAPYVGGMERFLEDLVGAQRRAGVQSFVLVHGDESATPASDPSWLRRVPVWFTFAFAPIAPTFLSVLRRSRCARITPIEW